MVNRVNAAFQSRSGIVHFLADVGQSQIEQFEQRIITGERSPVLGDLAQTHVHRLDGIGRVNDAPYLRRVIKERRDACPVAAPRFDDGGVVSAPLFVELICKPDVSLVAVAAA
jgi:hypothetical protein